MRTKPLLVLVLAAGCTGEVPDGVAYNTRCSPIVCGANSPEVARNGMHEANLFGEVDDNKIALETRANDTLERRAQIWNIEGRPYDLHVERGQLFGIASGSGDRLEHERLIGARLHVIQSDTPIYEIRIDGVRTITAPVGAPDPIEVYTMTWLPRGSSEEGELCELPEQPFDDVKDADQLLGMRSNETLVFEGDRIDQDAKTMNDNKNWDPAWFNFGCAGRTLAKLRLLHKTQGNGTGDWASRQAALKMLSADYCGTGMPFTRTGQRIAWMDSEGLVEYVRPPTGIEARWDWYGAACVTRPRRQDDVPHIWDYIIQECLPVPCEEDTMPPALYNFAGAKIISALYQ